MIQLLPLLATFLGGSAVSAIITLSFTRGKNRAETESLTASTYKGLVMELRAEVDRLRLLVNNLQEELNQVKMNQIK